MTTKEEEGVYSHGTVPATGILLTNLGTPDAPTAEALRRYLGEFLWDPRVVEIPRPLWWLILHGVILRTRPAKSAEAYQKVWTDEGSPLLVYARRQKEALQRALAERFAGPVEVALGMRYGRPSIAHALQQLKQAHCQRIAVLPLYPQYSGATTASSFDGVVGELKRWRWLPELRMVNHYHDDSGYVQSLASSVREYWAENGSTDLLFFSFHGMPKRTLLAGDPYHCHCQKTARLVAEALQLSTEQWRVVFQSRFGREEWLRPYADETLASLPKEGVKRVDVICPGFSADCLETLEEMAMQNRDTFRDAGGEQYRYIPALNDRADHITALADLIMRHVQGWPEVESTESAQDIARALGQSRERALGMGAER